MRLPKKISALPGVSTIKNADIFAIVQDGVTSSVTFQVLEGVISGYTASADTYVTGGVYNSGTSSIDFTGNTDFPPFSVGVSALTGTFTGNTSGDCITDLWVDNVYGCSPITMHDTMVFENADESLQYTGGTKLHFIRFDTNFDSLLTPIGNSVVVGAIPDSNLGLGSSGSYMVLSEDRIIKLVIDSGNTASDVLVIGDTTLSAVTQEIGTYDGNSFKNVGTLLNVSDSIIGTGTSLTTIISSEDSMINDNVTNSVILGGSGITATSSNTIYLPNIRLSGASGLPGLIYSQPSGGIISGNISTSYGGHGFTDTGSPRVINKEGDESMALCIDYPYVGSIDYKNNSGRDEIFKFGVTTSGGTTGLTSSFGSGESLGIIINSNTSKIASGVTGSVVIGGSNITGTTNDTVYVPNLNIGTVGSGTPVNNLGIDSAGNVVSSVVNQYVATIHQSGNTAPSVISLIKNDLSGPITWVRNSNGQYQGNLTSAFTTDKVTIHVTPATPEFPTTPGFITANAFTNDTVILKSYDTSGSLSDDIIRADTSITISVYN
jgi:hypothetical protein